jgi:hypothetical protein
LRADFERYEWQREREQLKKRSADSTGLVYKTYTQPARPVQQSSVMDEATGRAWNKWLTDYVELALDANNETMVDVIAEFASEYVGKRLKDASAKLREELRKEFAEQLGQLRADMNVQTGIARGEISELKSNVPAKRGRNVA